MQTEAPDEWAQHMKKVGELTNRVYDAADLIRSDSFELASLFKGKDDRLARVAKGVEKDLRKVELAMRTIVRGLK